MLQYQIIPVTHYQQNCSLLWCDKTLEAVVVDPGGDVERILHHIVERQLQLKFILLTHGHLDHVGGAIALAEAKGVPILGPHADDKFWLDILPQQSQMMGFPFTGPFSPERYLVEGDQIVFGDLVLEILHCPGHTPGHIVFFNKEANLAMVGDVLFKGAIGRTDFPKGSYEQLISSIRDKLWALGDSMVFIPGHGPMSTFGEERKTNVFVADKRFG